MAYFRTTVVDNAIKALPTIKTASGSVATFDTDMTENLINCVANITATGGGGTPSTPIPIVGYSSITINANSTTFTTNFGQTVYGGYIDVVTGKCVIDKACFTFTGSESWSYHSSGFFYTTTSITNYKVNFNNTTSNGIKIRNATLSSALSLRVYISDNTDYIDSSTDLNTILTNGIQYIYDLETPTEIQCNALEIATTNGTNNLFADTGDISECKYILSVGEALQQA